MLTPTGTNIILGESELLQEAWAHLPLPRLWSAYKMQMFLYETLQA